MTIFRAYDIRGIFGDDLTEGISEDIGKAFGTHISKGTIAVGMDNRLSSGKLKEALINGILSTGVNVIDIGMVPTPLLYFSIHRLELEGGIMITGSHNPPQYNGFKLCDGTDTLYGPQIKELGDMVKAGKFNEGAGEVTARDMIADYIEYVTQNIKLNRSLKVVIDAGNGVAGLVAPKLYKKLGMDVVELYCEPDGNFPNHEADPTVDENLEDLIKKVKAEGADFGVGFDGDGDRAGFVTDEGEIVRGDQALILYSREILSRKPGSKIIFEVKCSQALSEDIKSHGGVPIMYRTGHSFIKKKIKEEGAEAAGEMSGHFFFADRYMGFDDGIYAGARMAEMLAKSSEKMSDIISTIPHYHSTPEIRIDCPDDQKFDIVDKVTKSFEKMNLDVITVDGARVTWPDGWGLVRASNTTPKLILRFEAKTPERLTEIRDIIETELKKYI